MLLGTTVGGQLSEIEDYNGDGAWFNTKVVANYRTAGSPSELNAVVMLGTRDTSGYVDLRFDGKRLVGTLQERAQSSSSNAVFGPQTITDVSSFVVELSYATKVAVGDPVGEEIYSDGFTRYSKSSSEDSMLTAYLQKWDDKSRVTVQSPLSA